MTDPASADPATEKLKSLSLQDYDSSAADFDPFTPQSQTNNVQHGVDLIGGVDNFQMDNNMAGYTNGHSGEKIVLFDDDTFGLPDPGFVKPPNQGPVLGSARNMSTGELGGFQTDYGNNMTTGQMEYTCVSDDDENNLVDLGGPEDTDVSPASIGAQGDQDYYMSTGQPLVDDMQMAPPGGQPIDELMGDNYEQYGDEESSQFQNVDGMTAGSQVPHGVPDIDQPANLGREEQFYDGYYQDNEDIEGNSVDQEHLYPQMDPDRMRRSLSPERSLSPDHSKEVKCVGSSEQQCDNSADSECATFQNSEINSEIPRRTKPSGIPSKSSSPARSLPSEDPDHPTDIKASPKHKLGQIPILQPSPKLKKRPLELPPWNDNVIVPVPPRARPTLIGKQSDVVSPPARPKTAPVRHTVKDASSDSGVEEDRTTDVGKSSADIQRKYGTNSQNQTYKPGGGNVKIFNEKMDTHTVGSRTDSTKPRSTFSPHSSQSSLKSPSPSKPPSPSMRNVTSKIGSLKNSQHSPGGGNVTILNQQKNYSNVSSRVTSKTDHKAKGGDKKIEVQKLEWKAESKVGSLKNATHSPGGGNIKVFDQKIDVKAESKVGSTANIHHKPGGGEKKIETQKLEFKDKATPKVGSLDKVKYQPGGGDIQILDEKVDFTAVAQSKVGSMDKVKHQPGGGEKKIETQKLSFKETAQARTDSGPGSGVVKHRVSSARSSRSGSVTSQDSRGVTE